MRALNSLTERVHLLLVFKKASARLVLVSVSHADRIKRLEYFSSIHRFVCGAEHILNSVGKLVAVYLGRAHLSYARGALKNLSGYSEEILTRRFIGIYLASVIKADHAKLFASASARFVKASLDAVGLVPVRKGHATCRTVSAPAYRPLTLAVGSGAAGQPVEHKFYKKQESAFSRLILTVDDIERTLGLYFSILHTSEFGDVKLNYLHIPLLTRTRRKYSCRL